MYHAVKEVVPEIDKKKILFLKVRINEKCATFLFINFLCEHVTAIHLNFSFGQCISNKTLTHI